MPRVIGYTTVERVKRHLGDPAGTTPVGGPDGSWDTYLGQLITDYSAAFEQYLGRWSLSSTHTEYLDVEPGQRAFTLHAYPNVSVTSVYNDTDRAWTSGLVDSSDYVVSDRDGHLIFDRWSFLMPGYQVLRVIYTGGISTGAAGFVTAVPDLAHAADIQIAYHVQRRKTLGASGQGMPNQSMSWQGPLDFLPTVRAALDRRRRVVT